MKFTPSARVDNFSVRKANYGLLISILRIVIIILCSHGLPRRGGRCPELFSKSFALTWYRALNWYCSPARKFAAPDVPLLVTGQQGSPSPACRQLFSARNACAGSSSEESTRLKHSTKLGRTLCEPTAFEPRAFGFSSTCDQGWFNPTVIL